MLYFTTSIHLFLCLSLLCCSQTSASRIRSTQSSFSRSCTSPNYLSMASRNLSVIHATSRMWRMSSFLFLSLKVRPRIQHNILISVSSFCSIVTCQMKDIYLLLVCLLRSRCFRRSWNGRRRLQPLQPWQRSRPMRLVVGVTDQPRDQSHSQPRLRPDHPSAFRTNARSYDLWNVCGNVSETFRISFLHETM